MALAAGWQDAALNGRQDAPSRWFVRMCVTFSANFFIYRVK